MSEVLKAYRDFTNWLEQLKEMPESCWLEPIKMESGQPEKS
jgi:hypothetical protein